MSNRRACQRYRYAIVSMLVLGVAGAGLVLYEMQPLGSGPLAGDPILDFVGLGQQSQEATDEIASAAPKVRVAEEAEAAADLRTSDTLATSQDPFGSTASASDESNTVLSSDAVVQPGR